MGEKTVEIREVNDMQGDTGGRQTVGAICIPPHDL